MDEGSGYRAGCRGIVYHLDIIRRYEHESLIGNRLVDLPIIKLPQRLLPIGITDMDRVEFA